MNAAYLTHTSGADHRERPGYQQYYPLPPDTEVFSSLAIAIHLGLETLETPSGRQALHDLGHAFIAEREERPQRMIFAGSAARMNRYVSHFLDRLRNYFPLVAVQKENDAVIASISPGAGDTTLEDFYPEDVGMLTYNRDWVHAMVKAHEACLRETRPQERQDLLEKWQHFLFIFACATLHQLAHLFTSYLSLGQSSFPPLGSNEAVIGGSWLEERLYGGFLGIYADADQVRDPVCYPRAMTYPLSATIPADETRQPGMLFLMDEDAVAHRIDPRAIAQFVNDPRQFKLPFPCVGPGMTLAERKALGIGRIGSTSTRGVALPHNARTMRELIAAPELPRYSVIGTALRTRATSAVQGLWIIKEDR
ncbi:hypothetical protein EKO27_g9863 [Xylaria grammica]|uniref:Uncharacterized protein n=1 Tax=Xylaria grammica TaxID=363999 RepID=A0A439CSX1_9PEZI|nr:hypothetical protein EKO27_g9863 [Xylaria grammica]